jgi:hypothetical protein
MPRCHDFASFCRQLPRLKSCSLRLLHFPLILRENSSIQIINEPTEQLPYGSAKMYRWQGQYQSCLIWFVLGVFHNCPMDIYSMSNIYFSLRWLLQSNCLTCLLFIIRTPPFWNITVFWFNTTQIVILSHICVVFREWICSTNVY